MNLSLLANSWFALVIAILFGVFGTISMKLSHGLQFRKPLYALTLFYTISFIALTFAIKTIPLSVVYAVWSGVGTMLVAAIGMLFFHESVSFRKIIFLSLIIVGVLGVHLGDSLT
jgi:small multidrug resistance pump